MSFDFYDDWDDDENEGAGLLGGWGNDELDRLLAGSGAHGGSGDQPGRHRTMSYGTRRKGLALPKDGGADPTIVPNSSIFGFLDRLPWRFGGRGIRYKPSAADLQENLGRKHHENGLDEGQPLIEESDEEETVGKHRRKRSDTTTSGSTNNSLSSRGDLFPSEDEDDAIPLDDEFAMVLERRITGTASDDVGSGKKRGKRPSTSQTSTKTTSSRETTSTAKKKEGTPVISAKVTGVEQGAGDDLPSMTELKEEEERIRQEEEAGIERRRHAAKQLARQMGLSSDETQKVRLFTKVRGSLLNRYVRVPHVVQNRTLGRWMKKQALPKQKISPSSHHYNREIYSRLKPKLSRSGTIANAMKRI